MVDATFHEPEITDPTKSLLVYYMRNGKKVWKYLNPQTWQERYLNEEYPELNFNIYDGWSSIDVVRDCIFEYDSKNPYAERNGVSVLAKPYQPTPPIITEQVELATGPSATNQPSPPKASPVVLPTVSKPFASSPNSGRRSDAEKLFDSPTEYAPTTSPGKDSSSTESSSFNSPEPAEAELEQELNLFSSSKPSDSSSFQPTGSSLHLVELSEPSTATTGNDSLSTESSSFNSPVPTEAELEQELKLFSSSKPSDSSFQPTGSSLHLVELSDPPTASPRSQSPKVMNRKPFFMQYSASSSTEGSSSVSPKPLAPLLVQETSLSSSSELSGPVSSKPASSLNSPDKPSSPAPALSQSDSSCFTRRPLILNNMVILAAKCASDDLPAQAALSASSSSLPGTPKAIVPDLNEGSSLSSDSKKADFASKSRRRSTFPEDPKETNNCTPTKYLDTAQEQLIRERIKSNPYSSPSYDGAKALQLHYSVNLHPSPALWKPEVFNALNKEAAAKSAKAEGAATPQLNKEAAAESSQAEGVDALELNKGTGTTDLDQHFLNCVVPIPGYWASDILKNKPLVRHPRYEAEQYSTALKKHAQALETAMGINVNGVYRESGYSLRAERKRVDETSREIFNLKLKIFNLNEKLEKTEPHYLNSLTKQNLLYRVQAQEALRECRRVRETACELGRRIQKMEEAEKARTALLRSNRADPPAELEKQIQFHVEESRKYRLLSQDMQKVILSQNEELVKLREMIEDLDEAPSSAEMEELRRENSKLKAENERLAAESNDAKFKLKLEVEYNEALRGGSFDKDKKLIEFRGVVSRLQGEIKGLTDIQQRQRTEIREHEREILALKAQLNEYRHGSLPKQEDLMHTELLVESLREQLNSANQRLGQERATVDALLEESTGSRAEPCVECALRKNPATLGDTPLSELVARIIENYDAQDPDASALCQGIHYMELYFLALIDKLKYAMAVEDDDSRNQLIKEEIAKLENICHSGVFPSASHLLATEEKYEKESRKLDDINLVIEIQEEYAKLSKSNPSFGIYERDELLLSLLKDLSSLIKAPELCDPADDFSKFQSAARDIVASVTRIITKQSGPEGQQANAQMSEEVASCIHKRDELLSNLLQGLSKSVPVPETCDPAVDFDMFRSTITEAVDAVNCMVNDKLHHVSLASEEIKAHAKKLEEHLNDKMAQLRSATEKVNGFSMRYSDLKEKAIILKTRLNKARLQNDTLKQKIKSLEDGSSGFESVAFDRISLDE